MNVYLSIDRISVHFTWSQFKYYGWTMECFYNIVEFDWFIFKYFSLRNISYPLRSHSQLLQWQNHWPQTQGPDWYNPIILSALYFWRLLRSLHFKAHINDNANRTQVIQQHKFKVKVYLENISWKTHQKWGVATVKWMSKGDLVTATSYFFIHSWCSFQRKRLAKFS